MKYYIMAAIMLSSMVASAQQPFGKVYLQAAGLTCSMCSNSVQKALESLPAVSLVETDLKQNLFVISLDGNKALTLDDLSRKVKEAGFTVGKLRLEVNFDNLQVDQDTHARLGGHLFHFLKVKKQQLHGWQTITLLDENFVLPKEFKKVKALSTMACVQTGLMSGCCTAAEGQSGERVYHVTI
ncbi:MAG TPA: heavy-metal-associated domain-containing protein [Phnomibacter sp.]|nr:heavy-metal-associated domain-containing protein [Phnomibacter sp.]